MDEGRERDGGREEREGERERNVEEGELLIVTIYADNCI